MNIREGDVLTMKKPHPCGGNRFCVLQTGVELRLRCVSCGHEVFLRRDKAEKSIRAVSGGPQEQNHA